MWTSARVLRVISFGVLLAIAHPGMAQDSRDTLRRYTLPAVTVTGRAADLIGTASTASEGRVGAADLRLRPIMREGELQESVPGVIVTQHSGDGKANQYFARGFNLDHGTDFQTSLEGMPLNMPTHAHGQGYTDLNFLIPELVASIDYRLGVYYAEVGDFGSAGAAEYHLVRALDHPFVSATGGENGMARIAGAGSARAGDGHVLVGGELKAYNGPWDVAEELRKGSGIASYDVERGSSEYSVLAMAYHNQWNASDQIPLRAVEDGTIGRFGQIDPTDGGSTARYSLSGSWRRSGARALDRVGLFVVRSDLSLFSNFEYLLSDLTHGDQFNQRERRLVLGGQATHAQQLGAAHVLTVGVQSRYDILSPVGLYHTEARARLSTVREDDVHELGAGVFVDATSRWRSWFRTELGVRGDVYAFDVTSDNPVNSGQRDAAIVSPKASLVFTPSPQVELYVSGGFGFHSNDARGATITIDPGTGQPAQQVDPLVRSRGAEVGVRATPLHGWRATLSLWALNLDSELLFTGDGGTTEPSAASRRYGATWANFYRPTAHLSLDADVSFAHARFVGVAAGEDYIPGALENVVAAGITWSPMTRGPYGSIRLRHFGSYPLIEDNSIRATPVDLVNVEIGLLRSAVRLQLSVLNLFNEVANDIEYYYTSRLAGEPLGGVDDMHFHPVEPRQLRVSLGWGM
jgi:hypothetical protein